MASSAVKTAGTALKLGDSASVETFTTIAEIRSITGPSMDSEDIDVTSLDTVDSYREYKQGFLVAGEVQCEVNWTPTGYASLLALYAAGTLRNFQLVMTDTGTKTYEFAAYVKSLPLNISTGDVSKFNFTLKISGAVTEGV